MKTPKVIWNGAEVADITKHDSKLKTKAQVERAIKDAVALGEKMAKRALDHLSRVLDQSTTRKMKDAWEKDRNVKAFFGKAPTKARMKNVEDRLERAYKRMRDKQLKIRLKEQKISKNGSPYNGHNHGSVLSPRKFVLYPNWFSQSDEQRAAIIVHELLHDWHVDHKVKDPMTGKRVTAYGTRLAKQLAKDNPGGARRNPENFEQFCMALWP